MITFQEELFEDIVDDLKELNKLHWEEVEFNKDTIKLNPNYYQYILLDKMGFLQVISVKDSNKLIGYSIFLIQPSLHHADSVFAISDVIYIHPDYRKGSIGYRLIKFSEESLRGVGIDVINMVFKSNRDMVSLMKRSNFIHTENTYSKYIGDN